MSEKTINSTAKEPAARQLSSRDLPPASFQKESARNIVSLIGSSPTAFHVVENMGTILEKNGFQKLDEAAPWPLKASSEKDGSGKYYVTRGGSSLIAFVIPRRDFSGCRIISSHSDSPSFKLKESPELEETGYIRLNTEGYGGMLCAPWFDRPLSVAGRLLVRDESCPGKWHIRSRLIRIDRDLLVIPSLAIHMNREVNKGINYSLQKDMLPVFGEAQDKDRFMELIAEAAQVRIEDILGHDLYLYCRQAPFFWGAGEQYVSSPRLDDQECAWCTLMGFLAAENPDQLMVCCTFDNEETGSRSRQGAASTFLPDVLHRIGDCLGRSPEQYYTSIASGMMISTDNAHAVHPAHPDKADPIHRPRMNGGIVLKYNASQKYTTDGLSAAYVRAVCHEAPMLLARQDHPPAADGIPLQIFFNNSDIPGGSTLGNISSSQVSIACADIGLAQLAMHSPCETAGVQDMDYLIRFSEAFYRK